MSDSVSSSFNKSKQNTPEDVKKAVKGKNSFCSICKLQVPSGENNLQVHIKGKRHLVNIKEAGKKKTKEKTTKTKEKTKPKKKAKTKTPPKGKTKSKKKERTLNPVTSLKVHNKSISSEDVSLMPKIKPEKPIIDVLKRDDGLNTQKHSSPRTEMLNKNSNLSNSKNLANSNADALNEHSNITSTRDLNSPAVKGEKHFKTLPNQKKCEKHLNRSNRWDSRERSYPSRTLNNFTYSPREMFHYSDNYGQFPDQSYRYDNRQMWQRNRPRPPRWHYPPPPPFEMGPYRFNFPQGVEQQPQHQQYCEWNPGGGENTFGFQHSEMGNKDLAGEGISGSGNEPSSAVPDNPAEEVTKEKMKCNNIPSEVVDGDKHSDRNKSSAESTMGNRIAHLINPSNSKDEAEVRLLVTEFSKSRKKESLLKLKQQTESVSSVITSDSGHQDARDEEPLLDISPFKKLTDKGVNISGTSERQISSLCSPKQKEQKKPKRTKSLDKVTANSSVDLKASKTPSRAKRKNSSLEEGSPVASRKRKDSGEQPTCSTKKHRCSSAECFEECVSSALSGSEPPSAANCVPLSSRNTNEKNIPATQPVLVKQEACLVSGNSINDIQPPCNTEESTQNQRSTTVNSTDHAVFSPVESLINLFATGNVTVKKEFDDPLIDAIRNIDPAILNQVCETSNPSVALSPSQSVSAPTDSPTASTAPIKAPQPTAHLKSCLGELEKISAEEEKIKQSIKDADHNIQKYQALLDKWKTSKMKFQNEEEILRNRRNSLLHSMNDLIKQGSENSASLTTNDTQIPSVSVSTSQTPKNSVSASCAKSDNCQQVSIDNISSQLDNGKISEVAEPQKRNASLEVEVAVLPVSVKQECDIEVIDLEDSPENDIGGTKNTESFPKQEMNSTQGKLNIGKGLNHKAAHQTMINSLQVYENYVFTCSCDKTAKRFDLQNPLQELVFYHDQQKIDQLCVESIQGRPILLTSSFATKTLTAFNAMTGAKLKTFKLLYPIASMCRGKSKIYVALKNGIILTCTGKDTEEVVAAEEHLRSLCYTCLGGQSILITLSVDGHVSIRDADRGGLLIKYIKARAHIPLFMTVHNEHVYLSSAGFLSVADMTTGRFVRKYELAAAFTSLSVYKDFIFTTSFSGLVRCYSKENIRNIKTYYGAGKKHLTCIYVHQDWVFTGNRSGEIGAFRINLKSTYACQFGKCELVFPYYEDLEYHLFFGEDHNMPAEGSVCQWHKCGCIITQHWNEDKFHRHLAEHLKAAFPSSL